MPYTGFLCARYDNGQLDNVQQFKDGIGNGVWINYNPDGSKESEGTYVNNKTEGPATLFYEVESIKAKGNYVHLKNKRLVDFLRPRRECCK
jgi:antitoxin component YwqK of YwqJK toxin-antitoxin module